MMDCNATRERLFAWLDSEAAPEEQEEIEAHLCVCPACALEALALLRTRRLVADSVRVEPPPGTLARIQALASARGLVVPAAPSPTSHARPASRRVPLWASAAAAVGAALLAWWIAPREERVVEKTVLVLGAGQPPAEEAPPAPAPLVLSAREVNAAVWSNPMSGVGFASGDRAPRRTARRREETQEPVRSLWTRK